MNPEELPQPEPQSESLGEAAADLAIDAVDLATTPDLVEAATTIAEAAGDLLSALLD